MAAHQGGEKTPTAQSPVPRRARSPITSNLLDFVVALDYQSAQDTAVDLWESGDRADIRAFVFTSVQRYLAYMQAQPQPPKTTHAQDAAASAAGPNNAHERPAVDALPICGLVHYMLNACLLEPLHKTEAGLYTGANFSCEQNLLDDFRKIFEKMLAAGSDRAGRAVLFALAAGILEYVAACLDEAEAKAAGSESMRSVIGVARGIMQTDNEAVNLLVALIRPALCYPEMDCEVKEEKLQNLEQSCSLFPLRSIPALLNAESKEAFLFVELQRGGTKLALTDCTFLPTFVFLRLSLPTSLFFLYIFFLTEMSLLHLP